MMTRAFSFFAQRALLARILAETRYLQLRNGWMRWALRHRAARSPLPVVLFFPQSRHRNYVVETQASRPHLNSPVRWVPCCRLAAWDRADAELTAGRLLGTIEFRVVAMEPVHSVQ